MNQTGYHGQPEPGKNRNALAGIFNQARLIWRLYLDQRVPLWVKLIPTSALLYLVWPLDIVTELLGPIGTLDDLGLITLGLTTFVNLCPPDVVEEHRLSLWGKVTGPASRADDSRAGAGGASSPLPKIIDAPYTVEPPVESQDNSAARD